MKRFILIITLLLFATPCFAEIIVTEQVEYFTVTGRTKSEISQSMKKHSPMKNKRNFAAATTHSEIKYKVRTRQQNGRCGVIETKIFLHLTYTYPRLAQTPSKGIQRWWEQQLEIYEKHELTHGDIAKGFARKLERELTAMTDLNCATKQQEIESRFQFYMRKLRNAQEEFDRKEKRKQ